MILKLLLILFMMPVSEAVEVPQKKGSHQATFQIDLSHSSVDFLVTHMMITKVRGHFASFEGSLSLGANHELLAVTGKVRVDSLHTRNKDRDTHLLSEDFFDSAKFPHMSLKSTRVEMLGDRRVKVLADLTIRGKSKSLELMGSFSEPITDPWGRMRCGLSLETTINRKDYGITWNKVLDEGGLLIGEDVDISLQLEAIE